ncbi:MAG: hypothetical protein ACK45B_15400, partial [Limisphaerales bacterium]
NRPGHGQPGCPPAGRGLCGGIHPPEGGALMTTLDILGIGNAIVDVLVTKTLRAARQMNARCVTASGGVTCNRALRAQLAAGCQQQGLTLRLAAPALCTDNAAMVGLLAERLLALGVAPTDLDAEIAPNWSLADAR